MTIQSPFEFNHRTLDKYPRNIVGVTFLDEEPGFMGIYVRDENGGLWPIRRVDRSRLNQFKWAVEGWMQHDGVEDRRKFKEPTQVDLLRWRLRESGIRVQIESDQKLIPDHGGYYESFGSDSCSYVGFEATDFGDDYFKIIVHCPLEHGGKSEKYHGETFDKGVERIIEIFGQVAKRKH